MIFYLDNLMPPLSFIKAPELVTFLLTVRKWLTVSNVWDEMFVLAHRLRDAVHPGGQRLLAHISVDP